MVAKWSRSRNCDSCWTDTVELLCFNKLIVLFLKHLWHHANSNTPLPPKKWVKHQKRCYHITWLTLVMHRGAERAVPASYRYTTQRGRQTLTVVPAKSTNHPKAMSRSIQNILQKAEVAHSQKNLWILKFSLPILSIIHTITIGTMANLNGGNNRRG